MPRPDLAEAAGAFFPSVGCPEDPGQDFCLYALVKG
jgi:hypothetical protein